MQRINKGVIEVLDDNLKVIYVMEERVEDDTGFMKLRGELRNEAVFEFEDELMALLLTCRKVELDLSEVNYLASRTMKSFLMARQMLLETGASELMITKISEKVRRVFQETGCFSIVPIT